MRYTEKEGALYGWSRHAEDDLSDYACAQYGINKLGQLEDIEDELGIDFITLHKALTDKWFEKKHYYDDKAHRIVSHDGECTDLKRCVTEDGMEWYLEDRITLDWCLLKDHGERWALTKGELE